ncbi:hypothetical protein Tco_0488626 [Tanacetum coccineum]
MILEDLGSIIDSGLSEVVLGQPFAHTSKLPYDESLGLIRFAQRDDDVVFRMPQRKKKLDLISSLESVIKVPICDWKIYKDKLREVYQIFRVVQAPKVYPYFESMLKDFDRDDLVMFEPVATDLLWQFEAPIKS